MVISVVRVLSVFHFWLKLRPRSFTLYLVSRWPPDFPVSVLLEPEVLNSCGTKGGWRDEEGDGDGKWGGTGSRNKSRWCNAIEAGGRRGEKAYGEKKQRRRKQAWLRCFFLCYTILLRFVWLVIKKEKTRPLSGEMSWEGKLKNMGRTVRERLVVSVFADQCCRGDNGIIRMSYCKHRLHTNWYHWLTLRCACV